jgi:hypothetical protein
MIATEPRTRRLPRAARRTRLALGCGYRGRDGEGDRDRGGRGCDGEKRHCESELPGEDARKRRADRGRGAGHGNGGAEPRGPPFERRSVGEEGESRGPDRAEGNPEGGAARQQEPELVRQSLPERRERDERGRADRQPPGAEPVGDEADREGHKHHRYARHGEERTDLHARQVQVGGVDRPERSECRLHHPGGEDECIDRQRVARMRGSGREAAQPTLRQRLGRADQVESRALTRCEQSVSVTSLSPSSQLYSPYVNERSRPLAKTLEAG